MIDKLCHYLFDKIFLGGKLQLRQHGWLIQELRSTAIGVDIPSWVAELMMKYPHSWKKQKQCGKLDPTMKIL